ncbi:MAG: hypothetical protein L6R37_003762 [Teloschistes peruensis]|nr:MAG: hypothetical protein L6R37_003762 [Teloschistes peruensis]
MIDGKLRDLQCEWRKLYSETLPSLAIAKSPAQTTWPVHIDHCFARIILDNVIGDGGPWTNKLKSPAIHNMTLAQLRRCITLGKAIEGGIEDLAELDTKSLQARAKKPKHSAESSKRKREATVREATTLNDVTAGPPKKRQIDIKTALSSSHQSTKDAIELSPSKTPSSVPVPSTLPHRAHTVDPELHTLITSASSLTHFRRRVLLALCQVPSGHFTTYAALAEHLSSSARAVGNGLRNNPFAPRVPCHRVVASDGNLGGFGGEWGIDGKFAGEKIKLLREEGVVVDARKGRVEGEVWSGFR